jgi:transposase-like protein
MSVFANTVSVPAVPDEAPLDYRFTRKLTAAAKRHQDAREERDRLIRVAYEVHGMGVRQIARFVNMSHPGILRILKAPHHGSDEEVTHDG